MRFADFADELYGDPDVHRLLDMGARSRVLKICTPREINISRLLAWLLDPSEGHGLGDKALRSLLAQAGRSENAEELPIKERRFLSPAKVHNLALSSLIVQTELNVFASSTRKSAEGSNRKRRRDLLDIVAIDPEMKICVAVENKYGAREGRNQLARYYAGLEKLLPDYTRIHIFLDSSDEKPSHKKWLEVGYGWLSEFLREQEQKLATSDTLRSAFAEFREAVESEDEEAAKASAEGRLITSIAAKHGPAITAMLQLAKKERQELFLQRLKALTKGARSEGRAKLALFQLYHRRPSVWGQCFDQVRFAGFHAVLSGKFPDLQEDVRKINAFYSLEEWSRFIDQEHIEEGYMFPVGVHVHDYGKGCRVVPYMDLVHVRPNRRDALLAVADVIRKELGRSRPRRDARRLDLIRENYGRTQAELEVVRWLGKLKGALAAIP